jgi:hypothetical protein
MKPNNYFYLSYFITNKSLSFFIQKYLNKEIYIYNALWKAYD